MKVFIVLDDACYPSKIVSVFSDSKDANDLALTINSYVVEEWAVIQ